MLHPLKTPALALSAFGAAFLSLNEAPSSEGGAPAPVALGAGSQESGSGSSGPPRPAQDPAGRGAEASADEQAQLVSAFREMGIQLSTEEKALGFSARVEILNELLEYLLATTQGATHETLFLTDVNPDGLTAAMLALGVPQGSNVKYVAKDPPPTREEVRSGVRTHDVVSPSGGETYLYAAWREAAGARDSQTGEFPSETLHFHRMEDLLLDLVRGRSMRRHAWSWIGSRMIQDPGSGGGEVLAATAMGNLINVAFFSQGDTLVTAALPECVVQTGWRPNVWLLPDTGSEVLFIMSTVELDGLPGDLMASVPFVPEPVGEATPR
jgi:hypothetical protein